VPGIDLAAGEDRVDEVLQVGAERLGDAGRDGGTAGLAAPHREPGLCEVGGAGEERRPGRCRKPASRRDGLGRHARGRQVAGIRVRHAVEGETTDLLAVCPRCGSAGATVSGGDEIVLESISYAAPPEAQKEGPLEARQGG